MLLYFTIYAYLVSLSFLEYLKLPAFSRRVLLYTGATTVFLIFWLLATLRWKTGTDWDSYYDAFYYFSDIYRAYFEPGFILLLSGIRSLTSSYSIFLGIFTFLCLVLKFSFFLRFHKETVFTILLLFLCYYFGDIFAVRQNLAISLTVFSTWFIIKKSPILFVICVLVASTIHFTTILYLLAYWLYWARIKDQTFYMLILGSIFFGLLGGGSMLLNIALQLLGVGGYAGQKINQYLNESGADAINTNNNPVVIYVLGLIKRCFLIPVFLFIKNRSENSNDKIAGYMNIYIIGNIIYFLFAKDLAIFARASVPFLFFEIILIPYALMYFKGSLFNFFLAFLIVMAISASRFNALINSYYDLYVPYNSIFDKRIDRIIE